MATKKVSPFIMALLEGLKEMGRVVLIAVIPLIIAGLNDGKVNWVVIWTAALIAALKFLDKMLHKYGKETKNKKLTAGLTRF